MLPWAYLLVSVVLLCLSDPVWTSEPSSFLFFFLDFGILFRLLSDFSFLLPLVVYPGALCAVCPYALLSQLRLIVLRSGSNYVFTRESSSIGKDFLF